MCTCTYIHIHNYTHTIRGYITPDDEDYIRLVQSLRVNDRLPKTGIKTPKAFSKDQFDPRI